MTFVNMIRALALESYNKRQEMTMLFTALIISLLASTVIRYDMFGVYENAKIGFFIIVCCLMWMGMFDSILCICDHRDVLERDKFSGLRPVPFILANVVFQSIHALLQALIMFVVTEILIAWPSNAASLLGAPAVEYYVTLFLITFAAQMLGLAVSAVMKTSENALTFAPFLLIYELIMSETLFGLPSWLEPLRDTTIVRWGLNSLGTIFDIDALPWKAEFKIQEMVAGVAHGVSEWVSSLGLGLDTSAIESLFSGVSLDPSTMGVNHDLAEYVATPAHLQTLWVGLLVLGLVGAIVSVAGFCRKIDMR